MAARADLRVAVVDVDRVPAGKALRNLAIGLIIRVAQGTQRLLRKDHPPAEGGIRWIALRNQHFIGGGGLLCPRCGVKCRPAPPPDGVKPRLIGSPPYAAIRASASPLDPPTSRCGPRPFGVGPILPSSQMSRIVSSCSENRRPRPLESTFATW